LGARQFGRGAVQAVALAGPLLAALPALWLSSADTFAVTAVLATALLGALLLCADELEIAELRAECAALLLLGSAGAIALAAAGDLLSLLIGLETLSMAVAVLTGLGRGRRPVEAAFRFFVLAAGFGRTMIYGIGLIAYATGSFELGAAALDRSSCTICTSRGSCW
jgi:NADH-quinone oxidoreductase subunit N